MTAFPKFQDHLRSVYDGQTVLDENYEIINGNFVHKKALIDWDNLIVGEGNLFSPFCIIGTPAQHKYYDSSGKIYIGDNNVFYTLSTVTRPSTMTEQTIIGDRNHLMSNSIIHHDCIIENDTIICSNVAVAGNVRLMNGSYLGQNSSVHQFQVFGSYSILGMNSCVTKKSIILPGRKFVGVPCKDIGENKIALKRGKVSLNKLNEEIKRFKKIKSQLENILPK